MKTYFFLLFLVISKMTFAQESTEEDSILYNNYIVGWNGVTEPVDVHFKGYWKSYYEGTNIIAFEGFIDHLDYNRVKCPVGEMHWKYTFHGPYKYYDEKGTLLFQNNFYYGDLHGPQRYYEKKGRVYKIEHYVYGDYKGNAYYRFDDNGFYGIVYNYKKWHAHVQYRKGEKIKCAEFYEDQLVHLEELNDNKELEVIQSEKRFPYGKLKYLDLLESIESFQL